MRVPDAIEPAVGYRVWLVEGDQLWSLVHKVLWQPNMPFEAVCGKDHEVPDPKCSCGTYAAATFNSLFDMGYTQERGLFGAGPNEVTIAGQVNLWGGIVPGSLGWRAQFAYPKKLLVPYTLWKYALPLSQAYGVPFKLYNLQRRHGPKDRVQFEP